MINKVNNNIIKGIFKNKYNKYILKVTLEYGR